jgi:trk system potassium uptake protein
VLRRAGIETATGFAAVTNDDNANIMASQVAKLVFNVPRVTARVYDPTRQDVYRSLGLTTISPIKMGAEKLKQVLENGGSAGDCP